MHTKRMMIDRQYATTQQDKGVWQRLIEGSRVGGEPGDGLSIGEVE